MTKGSFITALLFSIHPCHIESITWISGRTDLLCSFFFLLSIFYFVKYVKYPGSKFYIPLIFGSFILSLMSKEMAITLPIIFYLVYRFHPHSSSLTGREYLALKKIFLLLILIILGFILLRYCMFGDLGGYGYKHFVFDKGILRNLINYLNLLIYTYYPFEYSSFLRQLPFFLLGLLILFLLKPREPFWFGFLWLFFTLMPVYNIFGERFIYIPSIGFCLMLGSFFGKDSVHLRSESKKLPLLSGFGNFYLALYIYFFVQRYYTFGLDLYHDFHPLFIIATVIFLLFVILALLARGRSGFGRWDNSIWMEVSKFLVLLVLVISFVNSCLNMNRRWFLVGEVVRAIPEKVRQLHPVLEPGTLLLFFGLPQHAYGLRAYNIGIHTAIQIVYNTIDRGLMKNIYHPKPNIYSFDAYKLESFVKNPDAYRYFWPKGLELNGKIHYFDVDFDEVEERANLEPSSVLLSLEEIDTVIGYKGDREITFTTD